MKKIKEWFLHFVMLIYRDPAKEKRDKSIIRLGKILEEANKSN
jgi:hypothetical protein